MSKNTFLFSRLQVGDKLILGSRGDGDENEIFVIHARVIGINSGGIHVRQTINNPDSKEHFARWWGIGRVAGGVELSAELDLGLEVRGDSIPAGQFLVFTMDGKPYVFSFTDIEVNRGTGVVQDLTKL